MSQPKSSGKYDTDVLQSLVAKVDSLTHKLDSFNVHSVMSNSFSCETCGMNSHPSNECQLGCSVGVLKIKIVHQIVFMGWA